MNFNLTFCVKSLKICVEYHVTKLLANFLLERGANFKQSYPTAFSTAETNWCEVSISDLFCVGPQSVVHDGTKIFSELLRLYTWRGPISPYYSFIIFLKLDIFYENRKKWVKIIFSTHALLWYGLRHLESLHEIRFVTWPICVKKSSLNLWLADQ